MVQQVKQTIALRTHTWCQFNDGRSVSSGGRMTHAQSAKEERVAPDGRARGYQNTTRDGRQTIDNLVANGSASWALGREHKTTHNKAHT